MFGLRSKRPFACSRLVRDDQSVDFAVGWGQFCPVGSAIALPAVIGLIGCTLEGTDQALSPSQISSKNI